MQPFTRLSAVPVALPDADIDTDIIFPARFLLITAKQGLGRYAFFERRYDAAGAERPDFVLNQPAGRTPSILVVGENFGCGSSREQAVWTLADLGVRCLIAPRFGEIFQANCFKNGLLAVTLGTEAWRRLAHDAEAGREIEVDLDRQIVHRAEGEVIVFRTPAATRDALLNGWDDIEMILRHDCDEIDRFEQRQRLDAPWLYTPTPLDGD